MLLELTEEEMGIDATDIANQKCPGFTYCMEMFLIKDMMKDIDWVPKKMDEDKIVDRIIYYIEFDAWAKICNKNFSLHGCRLPALLTII